jgi:hypothetical protein
MARPRHRMSGTSNPRWLAMQAKQSILVSGESVAATAPNQSVWLLANPFAGLRLPPYTYPNSLFSSKSTSSRNT